MDSTIIVRSLKSKQEQETLIFLSDFHEILLYEYCVQKSRKKSVQHKNKEKKCWNKLASYGTLVL